MMESTITIRLYYKDWLKLQKLFPAIEGESMAMYLRRYIASLRSQEKEYGRHRQRT